MSPQDDRTDDPARAFLAPVDLREHDLPAQAAFGFHRGRTEELLQRAADTIERLNRELAGAQEANGRCQQERQGLQDALDREKARAERVIGEAMIDAHKAGQALRAEAEAEAEKLRAEANALLEPAKQEAERLVAEAREQAEGIVAASRAEAERLASETEQYKLLAADVQSRAVAVLRRALEALGEGSAAPADTTDETTPFRRPDPQAAAE